jgi:hypothetical protein
MLMSSRVMEAPSKIASGLWGREGTAHFRRLTPPSFTAQNPLQGAAIFIDADVPQGHGGSLENRRSDGGREGTAHFRRLTPPSFAALTIADAAFVRGTEPAAGRCDFD